MKTNRSMPSSVVIPVLAYADVREAADWLCRAFGFVERLRIGKHRAQLSFLSGSVIVAGPEEPLPKPGSGHSVMVRVADVDSHCEQADKTGARIISPPTDYPYGERQYSVEDIAAIYGPSRKLSQMWIRRSGAAYSSTRHRQYLRRSRSAATEGA
jgi:uncharacterized glyoxalase superfamily protein PhnB